MVFLSTSKDLADRHKTYVWYYAKEAFSLIHSIIQSLHNVYVVLVTPLPLVQLYERQGG